MWCLYKFILVKIQPIYQLTEFRKGQDLALHNLSWLRWKFHLTVMLMLQMQMFLFYTQIGNPTFYWFEFLHLLSENIELGNEYSLEFHEYLF